MRFDEAAVGAHLEARTERQRGKAVSSYEKRVSNPRTRNPFCFVFRNSKLVTRFSTQYYTPAKSSSLLINTTHCDANSMVGPRLIFSVPSRFRLLKLFFGMGM